MRRQSARVLALGSFKAGTIRVLVATDIAARGIDVSGLPCVINYELPDVPETYVHRIGRTGRAGRPGLAISFCNREEEAYLRDIEKLIGKKIPVVRADGPSGREEIEKKVSEPKATPKANSEAGSRQGGALPCTWSKAEARAPATPQASAAGAPQAPPRLPLRPLGTGPGGGLCRRPPWQAPGPHTGNINGTGAIAACSSGRRPSKIPHWRCSAQPSPGGICIHLRQPLGIGPGHVFAHVSQGATLCALRGMDCSSRLPRAVGCGILDELAREKEMLPPWSGWKLLLTKSPIHGKTNCGNSAFCQ